MDLVEFKRQLLNCKVRPAICVLGAQDASELIDSLHKNNLIPDLCRVREQDVILLYGIELRPTPKHTTAPLFASAEVCSFCGTEAIKRNRTNALTCKNCGAHQTKFIKVNSCDHV